MRVALFANGWNGENLEHFIAGAKDVFATETADLFVFTSHASYVQTPAIRNAEHSIYSMPDYSFFDAVILFGSGMNSDEAVETILNKCKEADVPVILQGIDIDGFSSVTINNYVGMRGLCDHLIEEHQVKDVLFIAGPKENADSNLRLKALRDSLETHGLQFDDKKIVYGNWERGAVHYYIHDHLNTKEKLPDAIVCANDTMALFALIAFEGLGIRVPEDVIVSGFDNLNDSKVFYPSVASVDQQYREQGKECAKQVARIIKDRSLVEKKVLPCVAVPGESCGCVNCKNEYEIRKKIGHDAMYKKFIGERMRGRESELEMCIMSCYEYDVISERIQTDLFSTTGVEGNDFHIYINPDYKDLVYMENEGTGTQKLSFSPFLDVLASKTNGVINRERTIDIKDLLLGYHGESSGKTYIFCPLRVGSSVVGYLSMGQIQDGFSDLKYQEFCRCLDTVLEKYQSNIIIARLNEKLSRLMQKDSLTSVRSRIAYDNYVTSMDEKISAGNEKQLSVVMCDINNLKTINDRFGHDAGDVYIKNCCKLICEAFKHSPIFRIGGDEFVIVIGPEDYPVRTERLAELQKQMEEIDRTEYSPLARVSIATGIAEYEPSTDTCFSDVLKRADVIMYRNKSEMKK